MTDKDDTKNWRKSQDWIKDVLSKSGTELMEITATTSKNGNLKKTTVRKIGQKETQPTKMVYYQSTPLIVKTEPASQAQFCTPLSAAATAIGNLVPNQQQQQNHPHNYSLNSSAILVQQQQQQQQHQQGNQVSAATGAAVTSISNAPYSSASNLNFLSNIKTERLPPSITVYATTANSAAIGGVGALNSAAATNMAAALQPLAAGQTGSSSNGNTPASSKGAAVASSTNGGRKSGVNKPQFKCEQCGMTFGSKSAHTSHTKSHAKNGDLGAAPSTSAAAAAAAAGIVLEINEAGVPLGIPKTPQIKPNASGAPGTDPYQCNVCQKTFAVPARLIRHYRTHTGERPFECEFCHKLFSVKENLQVHRRIHTKERPYGCDVCGRAFEHSGKLHRHMRIHTGERPHKCSVCEKTFIQSGQLVIHMRTHTGEKPYKCTVEGCGKGFTCSKQLKVHSRTHTGEKPYHCDICFRDFGYNHVLKLHRVQHYGSKCYKCTICDETFKSKKEMEAHIKGHANEMPDDDEEGDEGDETMGTAAASGSSTGLLSSNSNSGASGGETTSAPGSPQSPAVVSAAATVRRMRKPKQRVVAPVAAPLSPGSHSPRSTISPSSSMASASRLSAGSPASSVASPTMSTLIETDHYSRDSGVASNSTHRTLVAANTMLGMQQAAAVAAAYNLDELPTDLSMQQPQLQQPQPQTHYYQQQQSPQQQHQQQQQKAHSTLYQPTQTSQAAYAYLRQTLVPLTVANSVATPTPTLATTHYQQSIIEAPTINPALLEAASIASRNEEDVSAALQIMQLNRTHKSQQQQQQQLQTLHHAINANTSSSQYGNTASQQPQQRRLLVSDLEHYDDTREANELIELYKRGDLARHGIHKGYAPVPKFESSLPNNDNLVRQVEAAIAPLRSSTESPERSSSPESDSMMMADRDVMTLPLRKRKLYMNEGPNEGPIAMETGNHHHNNSGGSANGSSIANGEAVSSGKVMRMSSVIQFAKAS